MKWIAAKVTFDSPDRDLATDLVADIFYALDLKGVVVDDPEMDPGQDWGEDAVRPADAPGVTGYLPDTPSVADKCKTLETSLRRLERSAGITITTRVTYERIDEKDWAEAWKAYFWPEKITDLIVVKPSWREYPAKPQELILEIDPGMAFGTGTHPTTALCIRMIQTHLKPGDAFLDVGTGSGILMIAAAKLGAKTLYGVDADEMAVAVAEKNLLANRIDRFELSTANLINGMRQTFDVVTANILAEVILELLPDATTVLKEKGVLICSGIITAKKEAVLSGLKKTGFAVIEVLEKEGWVAIAAGKTAIG
jgi:ribosomal protein L11 methyltransferase